MPCPPVPAPITAAQLYLADQRGRFATAQQQRYCTLNFGGYEAEGRGPVGTLLAFNEEALAPGQAISLPVAQATHLLLLPITGAVEFQAAAGPAGTVDVEQAQVLALPAGSTVQLRNPYEADVICFLHLWLRADPAAPLPAPRHLAYAFADLAGTLAEVVPATAGQPFQLSLGRLQGRQEVVYRAATPAGHLFAFVLAGAFELEGCLLHARDGLALRGYPTAELEALSNDALVLLLELPPPS